MTGGMVAPAAPSAARTHKIFTHTHKQTHTGAHAATQPLGNKSAALLHPVRLKRGSVPAANLPSCVVSLVNFSTVQRSESCLPHRARMKSCPPEPVSGLHHLFPPPPALLRPLSTSFLSLPLVCLQNSATRPLPVSPLRSLPCSWNRSISVTL